MGFFELLHNQATQILCWFWSLGFLILKSNYRIFLSLCTTRPATPILDVVVVSRGLVVEKLKKIP